MSRQISRHFDTQGHVSGLLFCSLLGAAIGVLWAIIQFAPAVWLRQPVLSLSTGHLLLDDCVGNVWGGSAIVLLKGGPDSQDVVRLPGRLNWNVGFHQDSVELALQADCCTALPQILRFSPLLNGWRATFLASESTWPLSVLEGLGTPWNSVRLRGGLQVNSHGISFASTSVGVAVTGSMDLQANRLSSALSGNAPIGSYRIDLQGGAVPRMQLETLEGDLQMSGQGRWSSTSLRMDLQVENHAPQRIELSNMLRFLGLRDGATHFSLPA